MTHVQRAQGHQKLMGNRNRGYGSCSDTGSAGTPGDYRRSSTQGTGNETIVLKCVTGC